MDPFDLDETLGPDVAYDNGWRLGVFDKCNGRARMMRIDHPATVFNRIFFDGYDDAYDSHERKI